MPAPLTPMMRRNRYRLSLVLGVLLWACGGSPTSAPGQGAANLPPQTNPGIKDSNNPNGANQGPKRTIKGTVVNAVTGEAIDKVMVYIEGVNTTVSSTPIPSAPPPGPDDKPGGGEGGAAPAQGGAGGEAIQLAQAVGTSPAPGLSPPAPNTPIAPGVSPAFSPAPGASPNGAQPSVLPSGASPVPSGIVLPPGTQPAPGASLVPGSPPVSSIGPSGSPGVVASPAPGASGSPTSGSPNPTATPYPLASVKPDGKGYFELKDVPEGPYSVTFYAPGYQAETIQGAMPESLDVKLRPLDVPAHDLHSLKGVVRQANNQGAANAEIQLSSLGDRFPGAHVTTKDDGSFSLDGLVSGNYALAGFTTDLTGEVTTFALVKEVPVSLGREKRTVSPTLVLRAVTSPVLLAGQVGGGGAPAAAAAGADKATPKPTDLKAQSVRAYISVGDGEIPISSVDCGKDGYYRLRLPSLPEGATYHIVAAGQNDAGQTSYVHKYNVAVADPKLDIPLPAAPAAVGLTDTSRTPAFTWEATGSDVTAYRVAIESIGQDGDTVWEGWTTGTAIRMPPTKDLKLLHEGESYRYTLTAVRMPSTARLDLASLGSQPWDSSGMTKPTTFEVSRTKPGTKEGTEPGYKPLSVPEAPTGASATRPSAKPSAKPSPKGSAKPNGKPKPLKPSAKPHGKPSGLPTKPDTAGTGTTAPDTTTGATNAASPLPSGAPSPKSSRIKPTTDL